MKKIITLVLGIAFFYSCSTSSDGNGNSTTTVVPISPSNLTGVVVSSTQINLSWTDNSTNETGFKIERKTGSGTYNVVGTTATDITIFNDFGLTPGTTYTFRVYSNNAVGNSLTYSNEINVTTLSSALLPVTIGTQIWSSNNLDVTTYRDGTPIPQVSDPTQWVGLQTGAWCYYNNVTSNGTIYGKLYNWHAVAGIHDVDPSTPNKILAPQGWHIPNDAEWTTLTTFLGGIYVAGGKMKSTGTTLWNSPNEGATNSSGFTGLPGGIRSPNAQFGGIGESGMFWSSTEFNTSNGQAREIHYFVNSISGPIGSGAKITGLSVRCLKD
jgi:uncharacterized protein (TIGR02145 family)